MTSKYWKISSLACDCLQCCLCICHIP